MTEFEKLKHRMKHIGKNVSEYRMTVTEAKNLILEFEELQKKQDKVVEQVETPTVVTRILDGGTF